LSILDLSSAANQPMQLGSLWITYNGEIYNYPELRRELEKMGCIFRTGSDTEVLLHGFKMWGESLCDHLLGMFAFAIWDDYSSKLFIGRDHVGQKPLFYSEGNGIFIVASEIKAIRPLLKRQLHLRQESVLDFILYDYVPDPFTWYKEVKSLLPGHHMTVKKNDLSFDVKINEYWDFTPNPDPCLISTKDATDMMAEAIETSVKSHLLADVDVGAFLSGGADSSCVVSLASKYTEHPLRTFSIGFGSPDEDELPLARKTAKMVGSIHQERIINRNDFLDSSERVLQIFDQPFADTSLVPTESVSAFAAEHVKVVLTGDGGDEAFGGYNLGTYISPTLNNKVRQQKNTTKSELKQLLTYMVSNFYFKLFGSKKYYDQVNFPQYVHSANRAKGLFGSAFSAELANYDHRWVHRLYQSNGLDPFRQAQWYHIKFILPGKMLVKMDRCSMQHSLEARSPFLSHKLIELMLNMPTTIRNPDEDWYKGLFRSWLADKVPTDVLKAPKRGFAVPKTWTPTTSYEYKEKLLKNCTEAAFVSPSSLQRILSRPKLLWKFLQIEGALDAGLI